MPDASKHVSGPPHLLVVVFTYNRAAYLKEFLRSVDGQTTRDFSLLLVNNGSTDSTGEVIEEWLSRTTCRVDVVTRTENRMDFGPFLAGLAEDAEYVVCPGDDDILLSNYAVDLLALISEEPAPAIASTGIELMDSDGLDLNIRVAPGMGASADPADFMARLLTGSCFPLPSTAFYLPSARRFLNTNLNTYAFDHALWLFLVLRGPALVSREITLRYRVHDAAATSAVTREQETTEVALAIERTLRSASFAAFVSSCSEQQLGSMMCYIFDSVGPALGREPWSSFLQLVLLEVLEGTGLTSPLVDLLRFQAVAGCRTDLTYPMAGRVGPPNAEQPWPPSMWRRSGISGAVASGSCQAEEARNAIRLLGLERISENPRRATVLLGCAHSLPRRRPHRSVQVSFPCGRRVRSHRSATTPDLLLGRVADLTQADSVEAVLRLVSGRRFDPKPATGRWYEEKVLGRLEQIRALAPSGLRGELRKRLLHVER